MFVDDRETKLAKKRGRIIRTSVWSVGLGIGLLVARYIAPLIMGESEIANTGFSGFGMALFGYGLAQLAVVVFMRRRATVICPVITYIIMPAVIIKLFMDMQG